jgi:hypothetical protein
MPRAYPHDRKENMSGVSPKQPLKLDDLGGITLKASEAFLAMGQFLLAYFERTHGKGALATICSSVAIEGDGMFADPAALSDWQECVMAVLAEDSSA